MKILYAVAIACCLSLSDSALADCNGRSCGVGPMSFLTPQGHRGADFRPACSRHDDCYSSGLFSRKQCDRDFLNGMLCSCQNSKNPAACARRARFMHMNVRLFGGLFYNK